MWIQALKSHYKGAKDLKIRATICNFKPITFFTTGIQVITSKPESAANVSQASTCSKKETSEKSPSTGSYLLT